MCTVLPQSYPSYRHLIQQSVKRAEGSWRKNSKESSESSQKDHDSRPIWQSLDKTQIESRSSANVSRSGEVKLQWSMMSMSIVPDCYTCWRLVLQRNNKRKQPNQSFGLGGCCQIGCRIHQEITKLVACIPTWWAGDQRCNSKFWYFRVDEVGNSLFWDQYCFGFSVLGNLYVRKSVLLDSIGTLSFPYLWIGKLWQVRQPYFYRTNQEYIWSLGLGNYFDTKKKQ